VGSNPQEPNVAKALDFLRRRGIWVAICIVISGAASYGYTQHEAKKYTATASLAFNQSQLSQEIAGLPATNSSTLLQQSSNLELLRVGAMAERTAAALGDGLSEATVAEAVSIAGQPESPIATVSATSPVPILAARIANTYAREFVAEQATTARRYFRGALVLVRKQLQALSPPQRVGADGVALQNRAQSLELLEQLQPNTVQIAQVASTPTSPSSPKKSKNLLLGAALGLIVGLAIALLLERLDPRIREPHELEAIYRVPLIGTIPKSAELARKSTYADLPSRDAEAFHMIRARLRSFNPTLDIRTLLVSSAARGEGKSVVAYQLASAAARMGSNVLLIEADLRNPQITEELPHQTTLGLPDVLTGSVPLDMATRKAVPIGESGGTSLKGLLSVLAPGTEPTSNPAGLFDSHAMSTLLSSARLRFDLVVIDAPELAAIPDAFLLLKKVDGVVVVARIGRSRRDVARSLQQALERSGAPLVGVVANGSKRSSVVRVSTQPATNAATQPNLSPQDTPAVVQD
jgi:polysaccharide biosynthesis transport protein